MQSPNSQKKNSSQNCRSRSFKTSNKGLSPKTGNIYGCFCSDLKQELIQTRGRNDSKAIEHNGINLASMNGSSSSNVLPSHNEADIHLFYKRKTPTNQINRSLGAPTQRIRALGGPSGTQHLEQTQRVSHLQLNTSNNTTSQMQRGFAVTTTNAVEIGKQNQVEGMLETVATPKDQNNSSQDTQTQSKINFALQKIIQGIGAGQSSSVGPVQKIRGGIVLQDNHRRRLQALAQVQHMQSAANSNSNDSRVPSNGQASITNVSNQSNGGNGRLKIINKKLITFTNKKPVQNSIRPLQNTNESSSSLIQTQKFNIKNSYNSVTQTLKSQRQASDFAQNQSDKLVIREEVSPGRFHQSQINATGPSATVRKASKSIGSQNVALGYRRHQVIQDITEDVSPSSNQKNLCPQKQLLNQNSNTSLNSQKAQQTQVTDLTNLFYGHQTAHQGNQQKTDSKQSLKVLARQSQQKLQTAQQIGLIKKTILNTNSNTQSRERNLNLKSKRQQQEYQKSELQQIVFEHEFNQTLTRNAEISIEQPRSTNSVIPQVSKRRPLILRKNNYIQISQHQVNTSTHNSQPPNIRLNHQQNSINTLNIKQLVENASGDNLNQTQQIPQGIFSTYAGENKRASLTRNKEVTTFPVVSEKMLSGAKHSYASHPELADSQKLSRQHDSSASLEKGLNLKDNKMFKVNRSKKKLDTARRSRIQQIQKKITNTQFNGQSLLEQSSMAVQQKVQQKVKNFSLPQAKTYETNQLPLRTPVNKELPHFGIIAQKLTPKREQSFETQADQKKLSTQKLQIVMPSAHNQISFGQNKGEETRTSQQIAGRPRNLIYNTTINTDDILAGTTTTKNINGNSLPQNSNKTFRRGQIFRQQNKKQQQAEDIVCKGELNKDSSKEALSELLIPSQLAESESQRPASRKRIVFQGDLGTNSLGEITEQTPAKSPKNNLVNNQPIISSESDNANTEIVGLVESSKISEVSQVQQTIKYPNFKTYSTQDTKVHLNEDKNFEAMITFKAQEALNKVTKQEDKHALPANKIYESQELNQVLSSQQSENFDSEPKPANIQEEEEVQQEIVLPERALALKNQEKQSDPFSTTTTQEMKVGKDVQFTLSKQEQMSSDPKEQDQARDALTRTADTSNRKTTISNNRNYCNSSDIHFQRAIGTTFSLQSHTSPEVQIEIPKFPMSAQVALKYYGLMLTEYEKKEILDFPMIYFIGASKDKKVNGQDQNEYNFGYDDEKGDYKVINDDHIGYRYEVKSFLGKGSFGTALKCLDHKTGKEVAMKIIKNKKKYYYQAGVELKILQFLKDNDPEDIMNVIHLNDYVIFRKHLCIGFELMSMNLFEFLKINDFNGFDHNLIRRFAIQLLYALKYLKMFKIIHCDLKPENILLKEPNKSGIKIIDFGSSTFLEERVYTYIQSRFYRAPEIMLGIPYNCAIDMWSFGCIMAELYIGYPIFPGESENDQMSRIIEMVGTPNAELLQISGRKDKFFSVSPDGISLEPIMLKNSRGKLRKSLGKPIPLVIGDEDPDFTDFVQKCLEWNPQKRMTPDAALKHVWILKGLPPQVLIHHQKMHNILTPELPSQVLSTRNHYIQEQTILQKKQEIQEERINSGRSTHRSAGPTSNGILTIQLPSQTQVVLQPQITPVNQVNYQSRAFQQLNATQQQHQKYNTQPKNQVPHAKQTLATNNYPGSTKASSQEKTSSSHKQQNLFRVVQKPEKQELNGQANATQQIKHKRFQIKNFFKN